MSTGRVRGNRESRISARERPETWRRPPLRIESSDCISCDMCIASCPPALGAVFRVDRGLTIIPELCSGCGLCTGPVCPVDCIHEDPEWDPSDEAHWGLTLSDDDPYTHPDPRLSAERLRRW
jgi:H+/Na+-translocating ferredoxin:NAD+ oxidoreductase subunit B